MNIVERLKDSLEYEYNLSYSERKQLFEEIDKLNNKVSELENINEKIGLALDSAENKVDRLNNIIKSQDRKIKLAIKVFENINKIYGESSSINDVIDILKEDNNE